MRDIRYSPIIYSVKFLHFSSGQIFPFQHTHATNLALNQHIRLSNILSVCLRNHSSAPRTNSSGQSLAEVERAEDCQYMHTYINHVQFIRPTSCWLNLTHSLLSSLCAPSHTHNLKTTMSSPLCVRQPALSLSMFTQHSRLSLSPCSYSRLSN